MKVGLFYRKENHIKEVKDPSNEEYYQNIFILYSKNGNFSQNIELQLNEVNIKNFNLNGNILLVNTNNLCLFEFSF